jgi:hypothetical protein
VHSTAPIRLKTQEERVFVPWNPTLARWLLYVGAKRWAGGKDSQALSDDKRDRPWAAAAALWSGFCPFEVRPRLFIAFAFFETLRLNSFLGQASSLFLLIDLAFP